MSDDSPVVDFAAADIPTEAELRAWASDQRVFISSVMSGMEKERTEVAAAVERVGGVPVMFERFGGRDDDPEAAYLTEVAGADIYLGLLGERYGKPLPSGYSATHAEYREAIRRGLRVSVWSWDGPLSGPQRDFLDEVRVFRTTGSYVDAADLADRVSDRLLSLAAEAMSPWVKVDRAIFRARRVVHDGKNVRIEARVRGDEVIAALEALRPGGLWSGSQEVDVTWSGRNEWVRVISVETETTAGRGRNVTLIGQRADRQSMRRPAFVDVALAGRSPEDVTEIALRVALLGEPNPLGPMGFMAAMEDPLAVVDSLGLPEDAVEPVTHLLLTEQLIGSGRAERLTALHVGPKHLGSRRVSLSWLPRRRYTNVAPQERQIEGEARTGGGTPGS
jgi:hypothetical protein